MTIHHSLPTILKPFSIPSAWCTTSSPVIGMKKLSKIIHGLQDQVILRMLTNLTCNFTKNVIFSGSEFVLTFHFTDNEIIVYTEDEGRTYQYQFGHKFNINEIESVQVWDDIEYIQEITFRYKTK